MEQETLIGRLLGFIKEYGLNRNQFYVKTGLANGSLDRKGGMSSDSLVKILDAFPELNPEWLLTGNGDMLKPKPEPKGIVESIKDELADVKKRLDELEKR